MTIQDDYLMSFELLLRAQGYKPVEAKPAVPFPQMINELLEYVNSPDYQQLIINERLEYLKTIKP